jgi:hypothetical protein
MPLIALLLMLAALSGLGWLARARRLRREHRARIRKVLSQANVGGECFAAETLDALPDPAARYLRRAVAAGAPLARSVDVRMTGSLRVGVDDWVPFEARQRICAERGFLWEARVGVVGRLRTHGADWLVGEEAGMAHALADWWPLLRQNGGETARSALGRFVVELIWLPSALTPQRGAKWMRGDANRAVVTPAGGKSTVAVAVAEDGRLIEVSTVRRRLSPNGESLVAPFGLVIESEQRWGDYVVPAKLVAAWGIGTDDREDFLRLSVDDIRWL